MIGSQRVCVRLATPQDVPSIPAWLDVVWSLAVIGRASPELVASVLDAQFVAKLGAAESLGVPAKLKLLNVNAVAKLEMKEYSGELHGGFKTVVIGIIYKIHSHPSKILATNF